MTGLGFVGVVEGLDAYSFGFGLVLGNIRRYSTTDRRCSDVRVFPQKLRSNAPELQEVVSPLFVERISISGITTFTSPVAIQEPFVESPLRFLSGAA